MKKILIISLIINFIQLNYLQCQDIRFKREPFNGKYYLLAEFREIPAIETQNFLKNKGVELLEFVSGKTYVISVRRESVSWLTHSGIIKEINEISTEMKLDNRLLQPPAYAIQTNGETDVVVLYFEDIPESLIQSQIVENKISVIRFVPSLFHFVARVTTEEAKQIAELPWVKFVSIVPPPFVSDNLVEKANHRSNVISAKYSGALGLTGKYVRVGEWDSGPLGVHVDLKDRTFIRENKVAVSNHATHVAGTVLGSGVINPAAAGMAPEAEIYSWDFWDWIPWEMDTCVKYDSIVITQNSYAYDPNWDTCKNRGYYDIYSYLLDRLVRNHPYLVHVYAAGNYQSQCAKGGYRTVSSGPQSSKNAVVVGAVSYTDQMTSFSSWGPVRDGRLKPEVCAVGSNVYSTLPNNNYGYYNGTSMACPGTSGTIALLFEHYRKVFSKEPDASTLKAVLCNTATDYGNPGPDFKFGFGRINAYKAAQAIQEKRFIFDSLSNNQTRKDTIAVPSGVKQLKVLLCWSDVPASMYKPYDSMSLINNLDLKVIDVNNNQYLPLVLDTSNFSNTAVQSVDSVNNIEQVVISNPPQGNYVINIFARRVPLGYQTFTMTYEFQKEEIKVTYPNGDESFTSGTTETIFWDAFGNISNFKIEYSIDYGQNWQTINSNVSATQRYYNWTVPAVVSSMCLIRVSSGSISDVSDTAFYIMNKPGVLNAKSCSGQVYLYWPKVVDAVSYDVFMEMNGQMVRQGQTTDTFYTVKGLNNINSYYFSINAYDSSGSRSQRMNAVLFSPDSNILPPKILFLSSDDTVCPGSSKTLSCQISGKSPVNKQWQKSLDGGKTWSDISGATDTFLVLTNIQKSQDGWKYRIRLLNECLNVEFSDPVTIRVDQGFHFDVLPSGFTTCIGDSAGLKAKVTSLLPYSFTWQKSTDTVNWLDISGAHDTLLIFDSLGFSDIGYYRLHAWNACVSDTATAHTKVIVHPPLSIDLTASQDTICYGEAIFLTGNTSGGDSTAYFYVWDNIGGNNNKATATLYQTGRFFITVYDNCSLYPVTDSIEITVRPEINVKMKASSDTICQGEEVVVKAMASGGNENYYYLWSTGSQSDSIIAMPMHDTVFKVVITDSCSSNMASDSIVVYVRKPLGIDITTLSDTVCYGTQVIFSASPSGGYYAGYQIKWNTGSLGYQSSFTADTSLWIKATLEDNCTVKETSDSFWLVVREPLKIKLSSDFDTLCSGNNLNVFAAASGGMKQNYLFTWENLAVNDTFVSEKIYFSKKYIVHLSDACTIPSATDSLSVFIWPPLKIQLTASDDTLCVGQSVNLKAKASGGDTTSYSFIWNITGDNSPDQSFKVFENTLFKVVLKDDCSEKNAEDSVKIFVHEINAGWKYNEITFRNVLFEPEDTNAVKYHWDFGDSTSSADKKPQHLYKQNGTFHVCLTVFNHEGCDSSYCQDIYVENPTIGDQRNLRNISVFPNPGKGHFTVLNSSGSDDYKFMLLNALGEIVQEGRVRRHESIESGTLSKGLYILLLLNEKEQISIKVIVE